MRCWIFCCLLLVCCCAVAWPQKIKESNASGNVDIVMNTSTPVLTCTGLSNDTVVWSFKENGASPSAIGNCSCILPSCNSCEVDNSYSSKFSITRSSDGAVSTLNLLDLQAVDKTNIACNLSGTQSWYVINVIEAYRLHECENGVIRIAQNATTNITCTGIMPQQNWYWTLNFTSRTVIRIDCTPNCSPQNSDIAAYNFFSYSILTVTNRNQQLNGATITCSKRDNATQDHCEIRTLEGLSAMPESASTVLVPAAAGGAGAALIVIIIIVVVIIKRRGATSRKNPQAYNEHRSIQHADDEEFREVINDVYTSADLLDENSAIRTTATTKTNGSYLAPVTSHSTAAATTATADSTNNWPVSDTYYSQIADSRADVGAAGVGAPAVAAAGKGRQSSTESATMSDTYYSQIKDNTIEVDTGEYSYAKTADVLTPTSKQQTTTTGQQNGGEKNGNEKEVKTTPKGKRQTDLKKGGNKERKRDKKEAAHKQEEAKWTGGEKKEPSEYYNLTMQQRGDKSGDVYANVSKSSALETKKEEPPPKAEQSTEYDRLQFENPDNRSSQYSHLHLF